VAVIGVVVLAVSPSVHAAEQPLVAKDPHVVKVSSTGFNPAELTIQRGDVVRWEWESGFFTVYSGTDPSDENPDAFPEFAIDVDHRTHDWTPGEIGEFHYFAQPNAATMLGTITVREATPVDRTTWGTIKKLFENS
jgi:plastocyanin